MILTYSLYVEVIIGDQSERFCGPNLPTEPVEGIGIARIIFASDSSVQDGPGFKVRFTVTPDPCPTMVCINGECNRWSASCDCQDGYIKSSNFIELELFFAS